MNLRQYLKLLDWTGRQLRPDKRGAIPADVAPILDRLQLSSETWVDLIENFGRWFRRAAGRAESLAREAVRRVRAGCTAWLTAERWLVNDNTCLRFPDRHPCLPEAFAQCVRVGPQRASARLLVHSLSSVAHWPPSTRVCDGQFLRYGCSFLVAFIDPPQGDVIEKIRRRRGLRRASAPRPPSDLEGLVHDLDGCLSDSPTGELTFVDMDAF